MALACHCSCGHDRLSSSVLADSSQVSRFIWSPKVWMLRAFYGMVRLIASALSKLLTVSFAMGGAFSGALTGALAGWASNRGIIRGAALVAIAGASVSLEFLDALRTSWCPNCSGLCSLLSMTELLQRLLYQRLADEQLEQFLLAPSSTDLPQVNHSDIHQGEVNDDNSESTMSTGLSPDSLRKLPFHVLSNGTRAAQETCCTICLQDITVGDIARSLPQCSHTFHLTCVDKWLSIHGSCPVCRKDV